MNLNWAPSQQINTKHHTQRMLTGDWSLFTLDSQQSVKEEHKSDNEIEPHWRDEIVWITTIGKELKAVRTVGRWQSRGKEGDQKTWIQNASLELLINNRPIVLQQF